MRCIKFLIALLLITACTYKNSELETLKYSKQFNTDTFMYTGNYVWAFDLMGGEQVSTHTLYQDSIVYTMSGKVYATNYTMKKLSFEKENGKWIGEDANKIIYVLFFKDITDSTITIYKHKCKANGLAEALNFDLPAPDATDDHGWNVYTRDADNIRDVLPIKGKFSNGSNKIYMNDSLLRIDEKEVKKLSFHAGERHWVGQHDDLYLQIFFKNLNIEDSIQLSATWYNDLEALYNIKYNSITNWEDYAKH